MYGEKGRRELKGTQMATDSDIWNETLSAIDDFFNTVAERVSKADSTALLTEELQTSVARNCLYRFRNIRAS